ncbi:hypothetical protein Tco_0102820, partial [Tanacetum coccineum]
MRMAIANNIKSTLPGIENQNAKDFLKFVEEKFRSADTALARTLMAELTTMKLDGLKSMQQHVLDMTNTATRLKTLGMNVDDSFLVKLIQEEARLKKQIVHSVNLVNQGVEKKLKPKANSTTSKVANGEKRNNTTTNAIFTRNRDISKRITLTIRLGSKRK